MQAITKFSLLTLPILIVTIDTKIFYQLSLLICHQKIHGDEIYFAKFALSKQNGCINLLHNSGIFAECATLSFLRWQKQCNFKRKKKVTSSLTHTRPNNSRHRKKKPNASYILELWIHKSQKGKSSKILQRNTTYLRSIECHKNWVVARRASWRSWETNLQWVSQFNANLLMLVANGKCWCVCVVLLGLIGVGN